MEDHALHPETGEVLPGTGRGEVSRPLLRETLPAKPPTLSSLLMERVERVENVLSGLAEDARFYGQESGTSLAALLAQKDEMLFWLKVVIVALLLLILAFGVYDGLLIALFLHLGL